MWPPPPEGEPAARFTVPVCPSTNNLYVPRRDGKGRAKTSTYKAWELEAGWQINLQSPDKTLPALKRVVVLIEAPFNYTRDIENVKPVCDLLKTMGIILDDRYVETFCVTRIKGDHMIVSLWPI